jgi:long-chain fatty acid transport protein
MSKTRVRLALLLSGVLALVAPAATVQAAGLYLFDRGARALGRGGAFIAAPDDPSALWYNPALLTEAGNQIVADAVLPILLADFERLNPDGTYSPKIKARPTPIPIPTLALSHNLDSRHWAIGVGIIAPNTVIINWDRSVQGAPSPARYSLIGLHGSVLANVVAGVAWSGLKVLTLGADIQVTAGAFKAETALSACEGAICSQPESRFWDAYATVRTLPTWGITGVAGLAVNLDALRLGASVVMPYTLRGSGKLDLKLPTAPVFEEAVLRGDEIRLSIKFPTIVRVGSEIRPLKYLRMEGAFVWEQWSRQKTIDIEGKNVRIDNVQAIGSYEIGKVQIERNMRDAWSIRGGFELFVPKKWMVVDIELALRGGIAYEKGAFSSESITPLTLDTDKVVLSGGLSIGLAKWLTFDTVGGWIFMKNLDVRDSEIRQTQALRPPSPGVPSIIGNGRYAQDALFLGGGFRIKI